jgi:hypothetical protein
MNSYNPSRASSVYQLFIHLFRIFDICVRAKIIAVTFTCYISHTGNVCGKAVYIMEALDGVNTNIFVEMEHRFSFPK